MLNDSSSTEREKITTEYIQNGFCSDYERNYILYNKVYIHFISLQQIVESGPSIHDWPMLLLKGGCLDFNTYS